MKEQNNSVTKETNITIVKEPIKSAMNYNFLCAMGVGIASGIFFHPIDRAMYLRQTDKRKPPISMFSKIYWNNVTQGMRNTVYQKIISNGGYFFFQGEFTSHLAPVLKSLGFSDKVVGCQVGLFSGCMTALLANPVNTVKYYTFLKKSGKSFDNAKEMYASGGIKPFFRGILAGVSRTGVFGTVYEGTYAVAKEYLEFDDAQNDVSTKAKSFSSRYFSAILATIVASPLNYARDMQYTTKPSEQQKNIRGWVKETIKTSKEGSSKTGSALLFHRLHYCQNQWMIGPNTLRTAFGMAIAQLFFDESHKLIATLTKDDSVRHRP